MTERASGEDRLMMVSKQLDAIQADPSINAIACPYCGKTTQQGTDFCCNTMIRAIGVLLDARDKVKQMRWMN